MAIRIAFFDAKSYDRETFDKVNQNFCFDIQYYKETEHEHRLADPRC